MKRLRAAAGLVFGLAFAGSALGQTTLAINGVSSSDNSASVNVATGATMTITLADTAQPNRPYGLFAAVANNGAGNGWYLDASGGGKKPFPITTGVATTVVENNYGEDISPDRQSSPSIHLDPTGHVTLKFLTPPSAVGLTFYFQAVVLKSGSATQTDLSNAVTVNVTAATTSARLAVSVATAGAPQVDHAQFGILSFNNGDPTSATFNPDPTFVDVKVDLFNIGDIHPWALHSINGTFPTPRRPRDYDWASGTTVGLNCDNEEYVRAELPPAPGADGVFGTSDDVPARSLARCLDNVSQEGFFLIVNKGANPNTPGADFFAVGRKKDATSPGANSWKTGVSFSPDGTRMSAIFDDSSASIFPQMFLIATDGTKPYVDLGGNATDVLEVTPPGTQNLFIKGQVFTNNRLWFIMDIGGTNPAPRSLWTVNIRQVQPAAQQVAIPINQNYGATHVVDIVLDKSLVVKRTGGSTLCFVAGDQLNNASGITPENCTFGDWYAVTESKPTSAVNVTGFPLYNSGASSVNVYGAGETFNGQSGYASLAPDETALAIICNHSNETSTVAADEVYIYHTTDANGDGLGDDAGSTTFTNPVTRNAIFDSRGETNRFNKGTDLFLADSNHLFFFYGWFQSTTDKEMDLYSWDATKQAASNLTKTSTQTTTPFNKKGNIYPEGYFPSPNGKYLIFSRSSNTVGFARSNQANLVALDVANAALVNVTGDEFAGTKTSNTDNPNATFGENYDWHLSFAGGQNPSLCYFAAPISLASGSPRNPWVFDANFPTAAIKLTSDTTSGQTIESLTGSTASLGCAWFWCSSVAGPATADLEYQDLLYYFRDDLTQTSRTGTTVMGQIMWLRAGTQADSTGASPPALIAGFGDSTSPTAEDPNDGKFYFFSLNGTSDYSYKLLTGVDAPGHQIGPTTGCIQIWAVGKP